MEKNELFDWSLFGALIRHERTKAGCRNTGEFSELVERRTHFKISKDVLYRIEQNRQEPTAMQFVSINLALFREVWPDLFGDLNPCMSKEWREIDYEKRMPIAWLKQDFNEYRKSDDGMHEFISKDGKSCVDVSELVGLDEDYMGNLFKFLEDTYTVELDHGNGEMVEFLAIAEYEGLLICK